MVRRFTVYAQQSYVLPKWITKPAMWERAIEVFHGPVPHEECTFIHRDFYPGNVLWHRRAVSGLVDWEAASVGPRSMDVAHCRINLLFSGLHTAELFTSDGRTSPGARLTAGPTSPRSSGYSTRTVGIRRHAPSNMTSRPCSNTPSTNSTAENTTAQNAPSVARHENAHDHPYKRTHSRRYTGDRCQEVVSARSMIWSNSATRSGWLWSRAWFRWRRRTGTNSGPVLK